MHNYEGIAFFFLKFSKSTTYLVVLLSIILGSQSCKVNSSIPQGKLFLQKQEIVGEPKGYKGKLDNYLKQETNYRTFGLLTIPLWRYTSASEKRKQKKEVEKLAKRKWEKPVFYDSNLSNITANSIKSYLFNKGYFNNEVEVILKKKNKKVEVLYKIKAKEPYFINKISYKINEPRFKKIVLANTKDLMFAPKNIYDGDEIGNERERISILLKNNGYYSFNKNFISFEVDSNIEGKRVNIDYIINVPKEAIKPYKIGYIHVYPEEGLETPKPRKETTINKINFITTESYIKSSIIADFITLLPDSVFSFTHYQETLKKLSSIGTYRFVNLNLIPDTTSFTKDTMLLNVEIKLVVQQRQEVNFELELNSQEENDINLPQNSSRLVGASSTLYYRHKNVAKRAVIFEVRPRVTFELPISALDKIEFADLNYDIGVASGLKYPRLLFPFVKNKKLILQTQSNFNVNYLIERNQLFRRSTINSNLTYFYNQGKFRHYLSPIEVSFITTEYIDKEFEESIVNSPDPLYRNLFDPHIISGIRYGFIISNQPISMVKKPTIFFRSEYELAGNLTSLVAEILKEPVGNITRTVFGVNYFQYFKIYQDFRFYQPLKKSNFVFRFFAGVGVPYGNSTALPFEKRFFVGGANSIRAWEIRNLGPGSFEGVTEEEVVFDRSGDIKLESNIELRFPIISYLKGAIFSDLGNVWTYNTDDQRENTQFFVNQFYRQIAIGIGYGIRLDFDFFLIRLDLSSPLKSPEKSENKGWVSYDLSKKDEYRNLLLNFGIGYPF